MSDKEIEVLLSGYLDGELTQQERQKVRVYLERDERYREILAELERVKTETQHLHYEEPSSGDWKMMEKKVLQDVSRGLGWMILSVWAVSVTSYGLWELATAPDEPLTDKLLVFGFFLAMALLFCSVLTQRMRESLFHFRTDKYKGVYK